MQPLYYARLHGGPRADTTHPLHNLPPVEIRFGVEGTELMASYTPRPGHFEEGDTVDYDFRAMVAEGSPPPDDLPNVC